ncbi:hypothetical protein ACLBOM_35670 [Escherichia coli]
MNMRNINVITALSVPGKTVSDDFMHAVSSNYTATECVLPAPEKFGSESLPDNFNMTAVGDEFRNIRNPSMNKLVSDGSVKKINYPVLYQSGITPPLCEDQCTRT